jgi:hypothetical protein
MEISILLGILCFTGRVEVTIQSEKESRESGETDAFNKLLGWLDSDRDQAGRKYIEIEHKLIRFLAARRCPCPEEVKDETRERVMKKIMDPEICLVETYIGEPIRYFYAVARLVHLEYLRKTWLPPRSVTAPIESSQTEEEYVCLEECLKKESSQDRKLITEYYREDKRAKIKHRKHLAEKMGIELNALRIQACRIRKNLRMCIEKCLENS